MRTLAALMLVVPLALVAGCSSPASDDPVADPDPVDQGTAYTALQATLADLPCEAAVPATGTSDNLRRVGNVSFEEAGSKDIDVRGDLLLSPGGSGIGIVDISDPTNPRVLSEMRELGGSLDVKFSPDNQTALVGTSDGIVLVDIRDPTYPVVEGHWNFTDVTIPTDPLPRVFENAHMLMTARIAGSDWVFLAPNSHTGAWVLRLVGEPGSRSLEFVTQTLPVTGGPLGPHDIWVTYDAVDQAWLLYSADSFEGWTVFNVDDPANPRLVGGLVRPETGYTHTIRATWVDGVRLVITIQELGVSTMEVYDATNLLAPVLVAAWTASPTELLGPQHNIQVLGSTLTLAHYLRGAYLFDLRDALPTGLGVPLVGTATLAPVARYDTAHAEPAVNAQDYGGVYDVVAKDGLLYVSSFSDPNGIDVVAYGCWTPGDVLVTSDG